MVEINRPLAIHIGKSPDVLDAERIARQRWTLRQAYPNDPKYQDATEIRLTAPKWLAFSMQQLRLSSPRTISLRGIKSAGIATAVAILIV